MQINEEDYLAHYGILRRSGRYPWGSGGNVQYGTSTDFLGYVNEMRAKGLKDVEIARGVGITTTELRALRSMARAEQKQEQILQAQRLKDKGYSNVAIGERMGLNESSVRALLAPGAADKARVIDSTAEALKKRVDEAGLVDVGSGTEHFLGVSSTRMDTSLAKLRAEGYEVHTVKVQQLGTGHETTIRVLAPPGTTQRDVWLNRDNIQPVASWSDDGGRTIQKAAPPLAIDPARVGVRYKEDGGDEADGVIYVRPGVDDLSLGGNRYSQVRIQVGDGHYLKGMAIYKDDLPDGVDLLFNTNKSDTGNKLDAMKGLKDDPDLPFGSIVRQIQGPDGKPVSVMNIVNEEGDWNKWSNTLSSQMLSKQKPELVRSQLNLTLERRQNEFEEIMALTNPTVRRKLLEEFADGTDSAAVHLKAASLPRQGVHVILPVSTIKPTEVYAPNYKNGETVVLIRHPHGGRFEIPELVVNNRNHEARKLLGDGRDAIGIHHSVAGQLSGADFDGDTVLVIPNNPSQSKRVTTAPAIKELQKFDPRSAYPGYEGMRPMRNTQTEMGKISNLITDMTIKQASQEEIVRAVKHSMVVIDAEKHGLDYRSSYRDNGIQQLKDKYQRQEDGSQGAATIISRAKSELHVPDRRLRPASKGGPVDKETGELVYEPTGKVNYRTGQPKTMKTTRLAEARDARTLSSGTPVENLYANHSNALKSLANQARREAINTPRSRYSPTAKETYKSEVDSLNSKLAIAVRNRPLERQAQVIANAQVRAKRYANPDMDNDTLKKVKTQALNDARLRTGAGKQRIQITPSEWDAIQAGAISESKLTQILQNADMSIVRTHATPRTAATMSSSMTLRARQMLSSGYTRAEIADQLGVAVGTLDTALYSEEGE